LPPARRRAPRRWAGRREAAQCPRAWGRRTAPAFNAGWTGRAPEWEEDSVSRSQVGRVGAIAAWSRQYLLNVVLEA
jgi:hypothetical protein